MDVDTLEEAEQKVDEVLRGVIADNENCGATRCARTRARSPAGI